MISYEVCVATYAKVLEQIFCLGVDVELTAFRLGEVEGGDLGDVLILALTLLFLELERDTTDGSTLNSLHQVGGVASNLDEGICQLVVIQRRWRELCKRQNRPCCEGALRQ